MYDKKLLKKTSKFLSLVLRHQPEKIGLTLDQYGWADTDELLKKASISMDLLEYVVENNDKKRFTFNKYNKKIKAAQGHSIKVDLGLKFIRPPDVLYHGTGKKFIDNIFKEGLRPQKRHHVHLSYDQFTAEKVGRRHGKLVLLKIDSGKMYNNGFNFMQSENGVWLTDIVPIKYMKVLHD